MAIQFPCPSCKQPIEVDDQFALMSAQCPYCRTVVTVPEESIARSAPDVAARPTTQEGEAPPDESSGEGLHVGPAPDANQRRANILAMVALIFAILAIAAFGVVMIVLFGAVMTKLGEYPGSQPTQEQVQRVLEEVIRPAEMQMKLGLGLFIGAGLALMGLATGISSLLFAARRPIRAWVAVVICGLYVLCVCSSVLMPGAGGAA